jgi:hypothetical protein
MHAPAIAICAGSFSLLPNIVMLGRRISNAWIPRLIRFTIPTAC